MLGRLFGGSGGKDSPGQAVEYNGYRILPDPYLVDGQYQTAGAIEKDFPDGKKVHRFVRAERHGSKDEAIEFSVTKARQIIDERGPKVFDTK